MKRRILIVLTVFMVLASLSIAVAISDDDGLGVDGDDELSSVVKANNTTLNASDAQSDDLLKASDSDKLSDDANNPPADEVITKVTVKKVWDDDNDAEGKRPDSVSFTLSVNGDTIGTYQLNESGGWQMTVVDLHIAPDQTLTVKEESVDGYTTKVTGDAKSGFTITNTLNKEDDNKDTAPSDDDTPEDDTPVKKTSKKTTTEVKKTPKKAPMKKPKAKHNTGMPVLLGVLALSGAGLALTLRRKE